MRLLLTGLCLVSLFLHFALTANSSAPVTDFTALLQPGRHIVTLRVDDRDRTVIFITPNGIQAGQTLPLVFFFHGAGGTARQAARTYGWAEKAEAEHFFMAFPEGLPLRPDATAGFVLNPRIWRDGGAAIPVAGVDDLGFFSVLLEKLQAALPVDSRRVYVTGFSNGAGMTFTLGSRFPNKIAAIAPVSSQSFVHVESLSRPLPVWYLTGTADPLIPYYGGESKLPWGSARTTPPVQDSVDLWARLDGCPPNPQTASDGDGVKVLRYGPGQGDSEVIFTTIEGNGHHWPGTTEPLPRVISGPALNPFQATDRIWDFFTKHPLP